jgi:hypothetical protein
MASKKITGGAVAAVAVVAGLGYAAYKILHGDWKFPDLAGALGNMFTGLDPFRGLLEGLEIGGIPGSIGGITYNIMTPGNKTLGEKITERAPVVAEQWPTMTPDQIRMKAGVEVVAEDVMKGPFGTGFLGSIIPPLSGFTIGSGLAAIQKQGELINSLKESGQVETAREIKWQEFTKRQEFIRTHPLESIVGIGGVIAHDITKPGVTEIPTKNLKIALTKSDTDIETVGFLNPESNISRKSIVKELQTRRAAGEKELQPVIPGPGVMSPAQKLKAQEPPTVVISTKTLTGQSILRRLQGG